jgi:hypothetical protein
VLRDLPAQLNSLRFVEERLHQGVYLVGPGFRWELGQDRSILLTEYPFGDQIRAHFAVAEKFLTRGERPPPWPDIPEDFGVCDDYRQILDRWPELANNPDHQYLVYLSLVRRADEPPTGRWRWHKWGPYIGTYKPRHEYLAHETIDQVYTFSIVELRPDTVDAEPPF